MKYEQMLWEKYQKTTLNRKEVSKELSISISTLQRHLENGTLPIRFKRVGNDPKSRYIFPIKEISNYLQFVS